MSLLLLLRGSAAAASVAKQAYILGALNQESPTPMFLRQSTASQEIHLGPFLDPSDLSAETGLTIANTDIKLWKEGGTSESNKNSGGATHIASGRYYAVLDATDTDTVGKLEINVAHASALPVRRSFWVLEEAVYDQMFAASAAGYQVPIWSSAGATVNLSATTIKTATDVETDTADIQSRLPAALVSGRIDASVGAMAANTMTAAAAASDLTTELQNGLATASALSTVAGYLDTEIATIVAGVAAVEADTQDIQSRLPAALSSGRIDASVGAMAANVMTAAAAASDLTTELQSGLATAAALSTVAGYIDTEIGTIVAGVAAVEADTQDIQSRLPAALVSGRMDASVGAMAANALTASALASDAVVELVAALLTTTMTESYNADGSAPTLAQAIFVIMQMLTEVTVSGTTMTIKKLDGSTTALTLTTNSASAPTSITRAA
jgi:uncharacterized protein Yka (UPF0111/DUF47 family)